MYKKDFLWKWSSFSTIFLKFLINADYLRKIDISFMDS